MEQSMIFWSLLVLCLTCCTASSNLPSCDAPLPDRYRYCVPGAGLPRRLECFCPLQHQPRLFSKMVVHCSSNTWPVLDPCSLTPFAIPSMDPPSPPPPSTPNNPLLLYTLLAAVALFALLLLLLAVLACKKRLLHPQPPPPVPPASLRAAPRVRVSRALPQVPRTFRRVSSVAPLVRGPVDYAAPLLRDPVEYVEPQHPSRTESVLYEELSVKPQPGQETIAYVPMQGSLIPPPSADDSGPFNGILGPVSRSPLLQESAEYKEPIRIFYDNAGECDVERNIPAAQGGEVSLYSTPRARRREDITTSSEEDPMDIFSIEVDGILEAAYVDFNELASTVVSAEPVYAEPRARHDANMHYDTVGPPIPVLNRPVESFSSN